MYLKTAVQIGQFDFPIKRQSELYFKQIIIIILIICCLSFQGKSNWPI